MRKFLLKILRWILKYLAQMIIWKYRPGIVGVTGSVGKTSTKLSIASVLGTERRVRFSQDSHNNQFGFPLAIIGEWSKEDLALVSKIQQPGTKTFRKAFFWLKVIVLGAIQLIFRSRKYPEILILEYGIDRPGDMKYLLEIAKPNISVITAIGEIPVHVEFFAGPEDVKREKGRLIEHLPVTGFAILNYDDFTVMDLKDRTRAHVMTYGFGKGAEVRISSFENRSENGRPTGVSFKLEYGGSFVPVRIDGAFGKVQAYASAAAACVGLIFGLNLVKISEALKNYKPAPMRMQLLAGIKYTYIIDDSYNASPLSMHAALDVLRDLPAKRRVAVLGDMLEIGKYTIEAHERVGRLAAKVVDVLVTVGPRAKFIAEAAERAGLGKGSIHVFDKAEDSLKTVQGLLRKGDLVLVKASRAMHLEKVVEEIKAF